MMNNIDPEFIRAMGNALENYYRAVEKAMNAFAKANVDFVNKFGPVLVEAGLIKTKKKKGKCKK